MMMRFRGEIERLTVGTRFVVVAAGSGRPHSTASRGAFIVKRREGRGIVAEKIEFSIEEDVEIFKTDSMVDDAFLFAPPRRA